MATGENFTSDQVQRELENAGDNSWKLFQIIMKYSLWKEGDPDLSNSTDEIKQFIQTFIDADKTTKRTGLQELNKTLERMMTHLEQKWELEIKSKEFYDKTIGVLKSDKVTQFMVCLLGIRFSNYMEILRKASAVLESGDVRIMITGEICAGKSTILNLLMGGNYLAVDHGPCTSVICELKDSDRRCASIHYKERLKMDPKKFELTTDANTDVWKRVRNYIILGSDQELNQQSSKWKPNIDKVVIYWPVLGKDVLSEHESQGTSDSANDRKVKEESAGRNAAMEETDKKERGCIRVTFVDSPGFGDDQETISALQSEAISCDAFIFVVNNGSHHGVEKDRLENMMKKLQERAKRANTSINPSSAFFLCNKADLVPAENKESLRRVVLRRLQEIWPGISEQQIFSFSAGQALKERINRKITQNYCEFINQICNVVVNAHHLKLEKHCCWLISFLESASALANNCNRLKDFAKQKRENALEEIRSHQLILDQLYKQCRETLESLESTGIADLKKSIKSCLNANSSDLCTWSLKNIPSQRQNEYWPLYKKRLHKEVINRIKVTVMDDSDVSKLLDEYTKELEQIIEAFQTAQLERSLLRHETLDVTPYRSILDLIIPFLDMFLTLYTNLVWGLDPFSMKYAPSPESTEHADQDEDDLKEDHFESDRVKFMQMLSSTHIKRSMVEPQLTHLALDISESAQSAAQDLIKNIDQGKNTLKEYFRAIASGKKISCYNDPFRTIASECHYFYTLNVMTHEIEFHRLRLDTECVIGAGGFGRVIKGKLEEGSEKTDIAAKVIRCFRRHMDNATVPDDMTIFRECCLMRQLMLKMNVAEGGGCPNFVHYYGSTCTAANDTYELILVMELCDTDLHKQVDAGSLIPSEKIPFPGKVLKENNTSISYALDIALQAARGLNFVHKNGIVHRDIKPSNFLMNIRHNQIVVKISDVGVSKEENRIMTSGEDIGTLLYQAPENLTILRSIHSVFSDVYSFGLLLWEVWYGEHVFSEVPSDQLRRHLIKKTPPFKDVRPPNPLRNLMNSCCKKKPITRPDMEKVVDELATLKQNWKH